MFNIDQLDAILTGAAAIGFRRNATDRQQVGIW
jgi:hypothetical protein